MAAATAPTELRIESDALVTTDVRRLDRVLSNLVATPTGTAAARSWSGSRARC
ncbi:hypothetical protein [Kitasatospora albolonga]|uniref:hypothetical protein n=1 Tax=Kitasatospora albolonga TaxID=68173 RepID=UPI0031E683A9